MFFSGKKKLEKLDDAALAQRRARDDAMTDKILGYTSPDKVREGLIGFAMVLGFMPPLLPLAALIIAFPLVLGAAGLAVAATVGVYKVAKREMTLIDRIEVDREDIPFRAEPTPAVAKAADLSNEFRNGVSNTVAVQHRLRLNSTARPSAPQPRST